jgi:hypothetical protein
MGNRPKYWCKRRVRLTIMSTGHIFATRFCAFRFATFVHKITPQKTAGYMGGMQLGVCSACVMNIKEVACAVQFHLL